MNAGTAISATMSRGHSNSIRIDPVSLLSAKDADDAILFGAGGGGRFMLSYLKQARVSVRCFTDNNPELWGKVVDGVPVLPPEDALRDASGLVILCSAYAIKKLARQCESFGCSRVVPYFQLSGHPFPFPNYSYEARVAIVTDPDVEQAMLLWADEDSLSVYQQTLKFYGSLNVHDLPAFGGEEYFQGDLFCLAQYRHFVDGGAFTGDTLKRLLDVTKGDVDSYVGFEPDQENFHQLDQVCQEVRGKLPLRLDIHPVAVGAKKGVARFFESANPCSTLSDAGNVEVKVESIDNALGNDKPVSFIKLDIEGGEIDGLIGAIQTIRRWRPVLAVCVYHEVDHLWKIPLMIHHMGLGYRFYLRKHSETYSEAVCYAVPSDGGL